MIFDLSLRFYVHKFDWWIVNQIQLHFDFHKYPIYFVNIDSLLRTNYVIYGFHFPDNQFFVARDLSHLALPELKPGLNLFSRPNIDRKIKA